MSISKREICSELIEMIEEYKPKYKKVSWNEEDLDMRSVGRALDVCINLIKGYRDFRQSHTETREKHERNSA